MLPVKVAQAKSTVSLGLEYVQVGTHHKKGSIYAARLTRSTLTKVAAEECGPVAVVQCEERLLSQKAVDHWLRTAEFAAESPSQAEEKKPEGVILAVKPAFRAEYARTGAQSTGKSVIHDNKIQDPLTAFEKGEPFELIEYQYDKEIVFGMDGTPLTTPIYFDYIGARVNNENYHLEQVVQILQENPHIEFHGDKHHPTKRIKDIPHYNATTGCDKCVEFTLRLPQEDYARVMNAAKDKRGYLWREALVRYILQNDLLGLKAAAYNPEDDKHAW